MSDEREKAKERVIASGHHVRPGHLVTWGQGVTAGFDAGFDAALAPPSEDEIEAATQALWGLKHKMGEAPTAREGYITAQARAALAAFLKARRDK